MKPQIVKQCVGADMSKDNFAVNFRVRKDNDDTGKTRITNQLHALHHSHAPHKKVVSNLKQQVSQLEKQIKGVTKLIEDTIALDSDLAQKIERVCTIKGLGTATVATIVAETGGFVLFNSRRQLISYAGYDVVQKESGSSVRGKTHISKKGNAHIRGALFMPAMIAAIHNEKLREVHERVYERTKIYKKANVAVQRKLLVLIYTLFTKNEEYDANYEENKAAAKAAVENKQPA